MADPRENISARGGSGGKYICHLRILGEVYLPLVDLEGYMFRPDANPWANISFSILGKIRLSWAQPQDIYLPLADPGEI